MDIFTWYKLIKIIPVTCYKKIWFLIAKYVLFHFFCWPPLCSILALHTESYNKKYFNSSSHFMFHGQQFQSSRATSVCLKWWGFINFQVFRMWLGGGMFWQDNQPQYNLPQCLQKNRESHMDCKMHATCMWETILIKTKLNRKVDICDLIKDKKCQILHSWWVL